MKNAIAVFSRFSLFTIFFWFGLLKVIGASPASALVKLLERELLPFIPFSQFIIFFGIFEMAIGVLFLLPRLRLVAMSLFGLHMICTFLPLFILPDFTWQKIFVPTLEGQYILKNLVLVALALSITVNERSRSPFGL